MPANTWDLISVEALGALASVIIIDIVLAGDNAIVVGMAAATLPRAEQHRVIALGIAAATVLRIFFALLTIQLLAVIGLTLAGGILLLWVAWKSYRELAPARMRQVQESGRRQSEAPRRWFGSALLRIVLADVSMSLDNVLAVAGTARDHYGVLVIGLALSVALMGVASAFVARLLDRYAWFAWIGLAIITFVALRMIYQGSVELLHTG